MQLTFLLFELFDTTMESLFQDLVMAVCMSLDFVGDPFELVFEILLLCIQLRQFFIQLFAVFL